jgi:FkbM family methyltransferase
MFVMGVGQVGAMVVAVAALVVAVGAAVAARRYGQRHARRARRLEELVERLDADQYRLRGALYAMKAERSLEKAGRSPVMPVEFRSQFGEDAVLWELFDGALDGFFVEAGAYDGYTLSTTYALEAVGWTGLLVEPIEDRQRRCAERRGRSRVVHAALGAEEGEGGGRFTTVRDATGHECLSFSHESEGQRRRVDKAGARTRVVEVPFVTLDSLLAGHDGPIDVVVIDVEGAEVQVLGGFDLEKHRPRVLVIEDHSHGRDDRIARVLQGHGYVATLWVGPSLVWVRGDESEILDRARRLTMLGELVGSAHLADEHVDVG